MPSAASLKVLIVDDQQSMRLLIRGGLQQLGFREFDEAADGEAGLKALVASPAQLIISDFNMPKLDGLGLLRAVRGVSTHCEDRLHHADWSRGHGTGTARRAVWCQQLPS